MLHRLLRPWLLIPLATLLLLGLGLWPLLGTGSVFLKRMETAEATAGTFTLEDAPVPLPNGTQLAADLYRPAGRVRRVVVLAHGVHHLGRREPRLTRYARELARAGSLVLVPDLPDLMAYELTPRTLDHLEAAVRHLAAFPARERRHKRVQLHGISFAGGLSLCVAGRPALKDQVGAVFAFGAHGDLDGVMRFLASGPRPGGDVPPPHPYGQAVVMRTLAEHLVPAAEVAPFRSALLLFLQERHEAFRAAVAVLPEASRRVANLVVAWKPEAVAEVLRPLASRIQGDPALSPLRQAAPPCPVFLLHGRGDSVIPASETRALGAWALGKAPVMWLVSDRIGHVELQKPPQGLGRMVSTFQLLRFWTALLRV